MNKRKIYTIGGPCNYSNWMEGEHTRKMEDADLICLTGGQDVNPAVYGDEAHPTTFYSEYRDEYEIVETRKAIQLGKKIIGICRGHQLLTALAGGRLIQDQSGQGFKHAITTYDDRCVIATSMHHQAAYPWGMPKEDYKLLSWSKGLSKYHELGNGSEGIIGVLDDEIEVEGIYFPKINATGHQGHPECLTNISELSWYRSTLDLFMANEGIFAKTAV